MSEAKANALVDSWNADAALGLTDEQATNLKALFAKVAGNAARRREGAKVLIQVLSDGVAANETEGVKEGMGKLRDGLRDLGKAREAFLDEFDATLDATQRAKILLHLVNRAKDSGKPVEQLIDDVLIDVGSSN